MGDAITVRPFTVRPATVADAPAMGRVFVDTYRVAHRGQVPEELLLDRTYETSSRGWARTLQEIESSEVPGEAVLIAVDADGEVVGLTMGGPARPWPEDEDARDRRTTGECYALYVDLARQGDGIGRALLGALAAWLRERGTSRLVVGVLVANTAARGFYEAVGGVRLGTRDYEEEGLTFPEAVYVWDDLDSTDLLVAQR